MIKLETHCHTGGSGCADCPVDIIADNYKKAGYGGVVVTNHMHPDCFSTYPGRTNKEKIKYYLSIYENTKKVFNDKGLKTFMGSEVLAITPGHSDFIIYGFDESFLYDNKPLFYYTQEELFRLCDKNGIFMYKCHPFRTREYTGDPKLMHGAESFNGHWEHQNNNGIAEKFCDDNHLIKMSGTDYHHMQQPITAGIYLPENINTERELTDYIFENNFKRIENKELYQKEYDKIHGVNR